MKPIHEFNDFLKTKIEIYHSSREKTARILKFFIFAEKACPLGKMCHLGYVYCIQPLL